MSRIPVPESDATSLAPLHVREPDDTRPDTGESFAATETLPQRMKHEHRIARLEERILILERELPTIIAAIVSARQPVCIMLSSLGILGYKLLKPIPVTIRSDGDEFIGTFFDANISSGGDTQQEAVTNLQSLIADFYDELAAASQEELGPSLQRQKHVLVEFVCRT